MNVFIYYVNVRWVYLIKTVINSVNTRWGFNRDIFEISPHIYNAFGDCCSISYKYKFSKKNYKYSFCLMVEASDHVYV